MKSESAQASPSAFPAPVIVLVGFLVSRVAYYMLGVRFDASPLGWFWQYIDPALLRANPGQSILYLHSQPPLMNVCLAAVVNVFPGREPTVFAVLYLLLGALLALGLYLAIAGVGIAQPLAACLALLFAVSPVCVLYENWLFYTYPVAVALVWAVVFLERFVAKHRLADSVAFFSLLACASLFWSMFHLAWLILCLLALLIVRRKDWKTILTGAALPLLLVVGWYAKNLILFREFTATTWTGMNLSKMTNAMLTEVERKKLYDQGDISALSLAPPFSDLGGYSRFVALPESTGVPVLDQRVKLSGVPNFNHLAYIGISRQLLRDDLRVLAAMPRAYLRGLAEAYLNFFLPADAYLFLDANRQRIAALAQIWNVAANGRFVFGLQPKLRRTNPGAYYRRALVNVGFWLVAAYLAAFLLGLVLLVRLRRLRTPARLTVFFIWVMVMSAAVIGNHTEVGENNRFRFVLDPLALVILGFLFEQARNRMAGSRRRRRRTQP